MGRPRNPAPDLPPDPLDHEAVARAQQALNVVSQRSAQVSAVYGDGATYERERVVAEARAWMAASAEAMLELGKRLIVLKENEPHGDFIEIVEGRLRMPYRTAAKFMQTALRFVAPARKQPQLLDLGRSKLFELLNESDDDLDALAEGGTVAGLDLDDMQAMTARELRQALTEARKTLAAKDKVIAKKDEKLNALAEAEELRRSGTVDEREAEQIKEVADAGLAAEVALRRLVTTCSRAMDNATTETAELQARQTLEYVCQRLADLCAEANFGVDVLGERVEPGWVRAINDLVAQAPQRGRKG